MHCFFCNEKNVKIKRIKNAEYYLCISCDILFIKRGELYRIFANDFNNIIFYEIDNEVGLSSIYLYHILLYHINSKVDTKNILKNKEVFKDSKSIILIDGKDCDYYIDLKIDNEIIFSYDLQLLKKTIRNILLLK